MRLAIIWFAISTVGSCSGGMVLVSVLVLGFCWWFADTG
jgi:hypothetical protein